MSASSAFSSFFGSRHILVKTDPNLRGPLKNMEKLSKRQPEKRDDDRYGVRAATDMSKTAQKVMPNSSQSDNLLFSQA